MLTMGEPIKLKTIRSMETLGDGFSERIMGNYQMLEETMTPTDMLHFIAAPPELYVDEAGMAPLVNHNNVSNTQNVTMQLVNNVLNRILVSDTINLSYQDRVFVENILRKIGVTDVREFIRQVNLMKQETKNTRELLTLYHSGKDVLERIREYQTEHTDTGRKEQTKEAGENTTQVYWLQQEVLNRLHTEEIYQEMTNLVSVRYGNPIRVSRQEMQVSEQSMNAEQLTLNRLRNETFHQNQNLVYHRINTYETGDTALISENYEQTVSNMVQAVLLNAISQIYHTRYTELAHHASTWQWLTDAIHVNAQNTFRRFESYHNRLNLTKEQKDEYHEHLQNYERAEITALQQLFAHTEEMTQNRQEVQNLTEAELQYQTVENHLTEEQQTIETIQNEILEKQEDTHKHVFKISEKKREAEIRRQLEVINRQNLERLEKLRLLESEKKGTPKPATINREKARKDALRALDHPEEVVMEYLNSTTVQTETEKEERERLKEIMGEDTVRILETLKGYQEHPERYPNVVTSEGQAMNLLMRDIQGQQEARTEQERMEQQELVHTQVREESSREVQRVLKETERYQTERIPARQQTVETVREQVELFHKQNETSINEELLQELENRSRKTVQSEIHTVNEQVQETNHVTELVTNKVNELKLEQDQNIERLVSQNVRQQLNTLSNQVFSKLEKRMDSERRRRGI